VKAIVLFHSDGSSRVVLWVEDTFDTTAWLAERENAAKLLDVVRIEEQFFTDQSEE
jgi:hypothetical protein